MKLDEYIRFNRLFDLYGKLLTEKQQTIVSLHIIDDLSLFEIAEQLGITKQAASDAITKAKLRLEALDEKLGLLLRIEKTDDIINKLTRNDAINPSQLAAELRDIWK